MTRRILRKRGRFRGRASVSDKLKIGQVERKFEDGTSKGEQSRSRARAPGRARFKRRIGADTSGSSSQPPRHHPFSQSSGRALQDDRHATSRRGSPCEALSSIGALPTRSSSPAPSQTPPPPQAPRPRQLALHAHRATPLTRISREDADVAGGAGARQCLEEGVKDLGGGDLEAGARCEEAHRMEKS